jgi:starch phosphorylase
MNSSPHLPINRPLPDALQPLASLAFDFRWSGSQTAARVWSWLDAEMWERTRNPVTILLNVRQERLDEAARDAGFLADLQHWIARAERSAKEPSWFSAAIPGEWSPASIAYFSMEFGLSEALPIYSGGLGMLAGDHLKSASALGVPLVGIGLLYQQGYFRQSIGGDGVQREVFPFNEPGSMPVKPIKGPDGRWPRVRLPLPGRTLILRTWEATVGGVRLLLLDSNDPMNSPNDRAITAQLYNADRTTRLLQELVLGVGGWQLLEKLELAPKVCHLNEGHAAFAVVARAASHAQREGLPFDTALWATRAGNVFTTHTPVAAGFDVFDPGLIAHYARPLVESAGISMDQLLALGRLNPGNADEPFNMANLAVRGCGYVNGVSRLHGAVSRALFAPLFPGHPIDEVPVTHVTNGVHVPSWDSPAADKFWQQAHRSGWSRELDVAAAGVFAMSDESLWAFRNESRAKLVQYVRARYEHRCRERGWAHRDVTRLLDPNTLTIGFARRFTGYKRPSLMLHDTERLVHILNNASRPVQLVIAGKAHPNDHQGKDAVRDIVAFCRRPEVRHRAVFLEDYDMVVAQAMVGGVDIWLNNPARPREACGTSGMKTLVNGGLHLSTLDGWWDEAYEPDVGWRIGGTDDDNPARDPLDAQELYHLLENEIAPLFYDRDEHGIPRRWLPRVRNSLTKLTPMFSSDRMVREYVEQAYLHAARGYDQRHAQHNALAQQLHDWQSSITAAWPYVHFEELSIEREGDDWHFWATLNLAGIPASHVQVDLCATDLDTKQILVTPMQIEPAAGTVISCWAKVSANRPAEHYTPRVQPHHAARFATELPLMKWQK